MRIHTTVGYYPDGPQGGRYNNTHGPDGTDVGGYPFWSGLINGKGRHYYKNTDGRCVSNGAPLRTFTVEKGKLHRFRIVGAQSNYAFKFSIQGHKFQIYASDGFRLKLSDPVDYLIVHSGERYDILVRADKPSRSYWIRAETLEVDSIAPCPHLHRADAILKYATAPAEEREPIEMRELVPLPLHVSSSIALSRTTPPT